jgi:formylmethanofuran dehydrogenase subunit E
MSSYEERMENLKEKEIVNILKAYKWERPLSPELKAEIDEFYGMMGGGCWFSSWLNSRIWCWLMVEWTKNDEELINPIHWEEIPSDDEEEEEVDTRVYSVCSNCGEGYLPEGGIDIESDFTCAGCVIRRNAEFAEMVEEETLTTGEINKGIEDHLMCRFLDNNMFDDMKEDLDEDEERLNWMRELLEDEFNSESFLEKTPYFESQFSATLILEMLEFIKEKQGEYGHDEEVPTGFEKIFNLYAYFVAREHYYRMSRPDCVKCDELANKGNVDGEFICKLCYEKEYTRYTVGYEDADPEDDTFETIEEARPLYDRLIATGRYGWVQILKNNFDLIEEWENPNNCGACGFLDCECSDASDSDSDEEAQQ